MTFCCQKLINDSFFLSPMEGKYIYKSCNQLRRFTTVCKISHFFVQPFDKILNFFCDRITKLTFFLPSSFAEIRKIFRDWLMNFAVLFWKWFAKFAVFFCEQLIKFSDLFWDYLLIILLTNNWQNLRIFYTTVLRNLRPIDEIYNFFLMND